VVLAAGTSSRYGNGANKLLLPFGERNTVISTVITALAHTPARPIVVVTGHQAAAIRAALNYDAIGDVSATLTFVHNPDYLSGEMLSSVKTGLYALAAHDDVRAALIVLGDQPLLRADVVERLCAAFAQNCGEIIAPRVGLDGPRGHPVAIGRNWWDAVLALPSNGNVRDLLRAHLDRVTHLVVNSDSILGDVDTPAAYQAALAAGQQINNA
jgi:molybdenum cofactor cytidylyltransferase